MKKLTVLIALFIFAFFMFLACTNSKTTSPDTTPARFGGFESQVKWGESLVKNAGCNDCHTPKKMGPNGPEDDKSLFLSGHPAQMPAPDFDPKDAAKKGLIVTQTFTSWTGPWGTTYAVNLTSDTSGIGGWKEEQFLKALHERKWMGLENTRPLMPPMSLMPAVSMSDDELKAIFAFLKTTAPVKNIAPQAVLLPPPPPASK